MSPEDKSPSPWKRHQAELFSYSAVGIEMGAAVGIGVVIGYVVDFKVFNGRTSPGFILFFMALGLAAAAKAFYRAAKELRAKSRESDDDDPDHQS
jgi:F0F1-type ATP synthase assembly protein I